MSEYYMSEEENFMIAKNEKGTFEIHYYLRTQEPGWFNVGGLGRLEELSEILVMCSIDQRTREGKDDDIPF